MKQNEKIFNFFIYAFLIFQSIFISAYALKQPQKNFWVLILYLSFTIGVFLCLLIYLEKKRKRQERMQLNSLIQKKIFETMGVFHEYVVFDNHERVIFSTNSGYHTHKKDFINKILNRMIHNAEMNEFLHLVESSQKGSCLLEGGGEGLNFQTKQWLASVMPVDFQKNQHEVSSQNTRYLVITFTNVSQHLSGYSHNKKQITKLEEFLDHSPFGIFYQNHTKHLVGLNETLAQWLEQPKGRLMGSVISDFMTFSKEDDVIQICTIRPQKLPAFSALLFPPSSQSGLQAYVLCRLDEHILNTEETIFKDIVLATSFANAPIPSALIDSDGRLHNYNKSFSALIDQPLVENNPNLLSLVDFIEEDKQHDVLKKLDTIRKSSQIILPFDLHLKNVSNQLSAYVNSIQVPFGKDLKEKRLLIIQLIDTSEQKRLEQQFIQSQKMQAVGQLAGGIAHDFNNLLTAMIGFCDLLLQRYMPNDPSYMDIVQIKQNANRAANLVRQLLAFSRQQNLQPKLINITDALAELSALLRRLIGARIELIMKHGRDIWPVLVDASQFEQVIINLVVNARDAMENINHGQLIIKTSNFTNNLLRRVGHDTMPVGDYVLIEVVDTGHGIDNEVMDHIFEPFFSTKEVGAGTGLGLSTVFGIVKQTGGFVGVDSAVNQGTTFKIFLPRHTQLESLPSLNIPESKFSDLTGSETILLVEDEDAVRLFSSRALRDKGYKVLEAENGDTALNLIDSGEKFDLLITDVVMPRIDGPTLCQKIRTIYPNLKTIFISGYAEDTFRESLGHNSHIHFLQKPFTLKDLASKVKDVLKGSD